MSQSVKTIDTLTSAQGALADFDNLTIGSMVGCPDVPVSGARNDRQRERPADALRADIGNRFIEYQSDYDDPIAVAEKALARL